MSNEEQNQPASSEQPAQPTPPVQPTQQTPVTSQTVEPQLPPITVTQNPVMIQNSVDRKNVTDLSESNQSGSQTKKEE